MTIIKFPTVWLVQSKQDHRIFCNVKAATETQALRLGQHRLKLPVSNLTATEYERETA